MPPKTASFGVEIHGVKEFMDEVKRVEKDGKHTLGKLILDAALMTHKFAVDNIRKGARSGKLYTRWGGSKQHQASAPGEFPKSDTGTLLQNLTVSGPDNSREYMDGYGNGSPPSAKDALRGLEVGSRKGAPHGFFLEYGTSTMAPRPWLSRAFSMMTFNWLYKYRG